MIKVYIAKISNILNHKFWDILMLFSAEYENHENLPGLVGPMSLLKPGKKELNTWISLPAYAYFHSCALLCSLWCLSLQAKTHWNLPKLTKRPFCPRLALDYTFTPFHNSEKHWVSNPQNVHIAQIDMIDHGKCFDLCFYTVCLHFSFR